MNRVMPMYLAQAWGTGLFLAGILTGAYISRHNQPEVLISPLPAGYVIVYPTPAPAPETLQAQIERIEDTTPIAETTPGGTTRGQENIKRLIAAAFKPYGSQAVNQALKIAYCESKYQNYCNDGLNRNGSTDCGIFQININAHRVGRENMLTPEKNINQAVKLYRRNGFNDWYSSAHCWQ